MKKLLLGCLITCIFAPVHAATYQSSLAYDDVVEFINDYSKKEKYSKEELVEFFARTKIKASVVKQNNNQPEVKLNWETYQKRVVTDAKIESGKAFLIDNHNALKKAEDRYGVPAEVIASIIGIESFYGKYKGNFKAIEAISTMAFEGSERRRSFFKKELEEYLDYCFKNNIDPLIPKSSWAGAFGYPQFIPSSINHYAIDFNSDGKVDLINSIEDSIGSVGNYMNENGWITDNYIAEEVFNVQKNDYEKFNSFSLSYSVKELEENGVTFNRSMRKDKKLKIFSVSKNNSEHYMVGYNNFQTITRYNRSNLYALAVFDLASKIKGSEVK